MTGGNDLIYIQNVQREVANLLLNKYACLLLSNIEPVCALTVSYSLAAKTLVVLQKKTIILSSFSNAFRR